MFLINHHFVMGDADNDADDDEKAFKSPTSQSLLGLARYRPMTYVLIMHVDTTWHLPLFPGWFPSTLYNTRRRSTSTPRVTQRLHQSHDHSRIHVNVNDCIYSRKESVYYLLLLSLKFLPFPAKSTSDLSSLAFLRTRRLIIFLNKQRHSFLR